MNTRPSILRTSLEAAVLLALIFLATDYAGPAIGCPWWLIPAINMTVALTLPRLWFRHRLGPPNKRRQPVDFWVDTTENPMDPHGDGTLRPGDPIFDNVFMPLLTGEKDHVIIRRWHDGIHEIPEDQ